MKVIPMESWQAEYAERERQLKEQLKQMTLEREEFLKASSFWQNESIADRAKLTEMTKERDELLVIRNNYRYEHLHLHDQLEITAGSELRLREALESLEIDLKRNADGKQPYGGFHSPIEEFQSIWGRLNKVLSTPPSELTAALMKLVSESESSCRCEGWHEKDCDIGIALTRVQVALGRKL